MSEDIHKWTDGRYTLMFDEHTFFVWDNEKDDRMCALEVTEKLNEQQATLSALKKENEQLRNKLEVANARSGYYQRMLEKWCVKDE